VIYASGGQTWPNPHPWDQVSLDSKVRHVGDRVAVVAAESPEIARAALDLIEVEYTLLPAVFDRCRASPARAPVIRRRARRSRPWNVERNIAVQIHAAVGDVEQGLTESDHLFERTYHVHQVQQASIEPHIVVTYWDEDERLVIRTSTQVPFHVRRMIAPLIGLPVKRIRVVKPRIGGGFGGKQEMLIEDLCAHLTIATGRPVRFEYTRSQEFTSARSRHPMVVTFRAGCQRDGTLPRARPAHCLQHRCLRHTWADRVQRRRSARAGDLPAPPTCSSPPKWSIPTFQHQERSAATAHPRVNLPLESLMEEIAESLALDAVEFRLKNAVRSGDPIPITAALGEGDSGRQPQIVQSCGLEQCVTQGAAAVAWDRRGDPAWRIDPARPHIRRGLGMALCMHGTAIPGMDMGAASIKMNDDGSFNVLVGGTDLGTGSDTVLAQIACRNIWAHRSTTS
jgi:putative selenate reductase molybdopterin-binding subunit